MTSIKNTTESLAIRKNCVNLQCDKTILYDQKYKNNPFGRVSVALLSRIAVVLSQKRGDTPSFV